jgi:hypothetical protein
MTAPAGQVLTQFRPAGLPTMWTQRTTTPAASGATVTISATPTPAGANWNLAAVEIRKQ